MTRKVTIRLRPEDLKDNPALLALVERALNKTPTYLEHVEVAIERQPVAEFEPDPVATDRALGNLARRGVVIVARIVEFAVKAGGPLVG